MSRLAPAMVLLLLAVLLLLVLAASLGAGSLNTSLEDLQGLWQGEASLEASVIRDLRLPRALSALLVGAELALAGLLMQALVRNPLADPYVLGVSGGASVAALAAMLAGWQGFWLSGAALGGALVNMFLVFGLVRGAWDQSSGRLLLTGVVLASGWGALVSFMLALGDTRALKGMLFWLMGDFSHAPAPGAQLWVLVTALCLAQALGRPLNLVARGGLQARALGVNTRLLWPLLFVLTSLLTASAVMQAGAVGFVGLVVPHMMRLLLGGDHRWLVPASALGGALLLLAADTLARTLVAPQQLPVGVITAFLGVPLFLWLLNGRRAS